LSLNNLEMVKKWVSSAKTFFI